MQIYIAHNRNTSNALQHANTGCNVGVLWPNGWMHQIPLGTEVGLSLGDIVLDGTHLPSLKGAQSPIFGPCPLWPNGWMDYSATWYGLWR